MCERNSEPGLGEIKKLAERLARIFVELYPDLNARMITERTKEWENPIRHTGLVRSKIVDQMVEAHILGDLPKAIASTNVSHEEYSHAGETVRECLRSVRCWAGVGSVVPMRLYEGWLLQHIHNLREHAWHKAQKLRGELPTPPAAN